MKFLAIAAGIMAIIVSCNREEKVDYFEGMLIYETDDAMLDNVPVDSGKFIKYYVKGDSIRVESYTAMGKQVHLRYKNSKTGVLIFVFSGQKVALLQDFTKDTLNRGFHIEKLEDSQEIADLRSEKLSISGAHLEKPVEILYSPNYPNHIVDIYDGLIPGLPTKYQLIVQQFAVNYTLVKIEQKAIETSKFEIPKDCLVMSMEEFMDFMSGQQIEQ